MMKCMSVINATAVVLGWLVSVALIAVLVSNSSADPIAACAGAPPGTFVNNPIDCQSFWICNGGAHTAGRCPFGYNFNPASTTCDLPVDYPCSDSDEPEVPTTTTVPPATETTAVPTTVAPTPTPTVTVTTVSPIDEPTLPPPADTNVCVDRADGHFINNPANCQAYFVCHNGQAFNAQCRPGLNFNEAAQVCDNPANFPCDDGAFRCPDTGIAFFAIADSCTQFRFCFAGALRIRDCAPGLHFDEQLNRCNFEEIVNCTRGLCPQINDPNNVVTHPSRVSCDGFYICYGGELESFTCAPGLHWNQHRRICDFRHNVNCTIVPPPPTTQAPPVIRCPAASVPGLHIIPHPHDCAVFYICSQGEPHEQTCPDDLLFDPRLGTCNKPGRFECFVE